MLLKRGRLLTKPAAQATQPWVSREGWMDGWRLHCFLLPGITFLKGKHVLVFETQTRQHLLLFFCPLCVQPKERWTDENKKEALLK